MQPRYFKHNPQSIIQAEFEKIHQENMRGMPFCREDLQVTTSSFQLMDNHWVGAVLTPWMLSLLIVPAEHASWSDEFKVTDKVGIRLATGDYHFTFGELEELGLYLACSLLSPVDSINTQADGEQILHDLQHLAWSQPIAIQEVEDSSKRHLLTGLKRETV